MLFPYLRIRYHNLCRTTLAAIQAKYWLITRELEIEIVNIYGIYGIFLTYFHYFALEVWIFSVSVAYQVYSFSSNNCIKVLLIKTKHWLSGTHLYAYIHTHFPGLFLSFKLYFIHSSRNYYLTNLQYIAFLTFRFHKPTKNTCF